LRAEVLERLLLAHTPEEALLGQWDMERLAADLDLVFGIALPL